MTAAVYLDEESSLVYTRSNREYLLEDMVI